MNTNYRFKVGSINSFESASYRDARFYYFLAPHCTTKMELLPFGRDPVYVGLLRVCLAEAIYRSPHYVLRARASDTLRPIYLKDPTLRVRGY